MGTHTKALHPHANTTEVVSLPVPVKVPKCISRGTLLTSQHCALECICFAPAQSSQMSHVQGSPHDNYRNNFICTLHYFTSYTIYKYININDYKSLSGDWRKRETQSHRKSYVLLVSPIFTCTTLCERIEHSTESIEYTQDIYLSIYIYIYI